MINLIHSHFLLPQSPENAPDNLSPTAEAPLLVASAAAVKDPLVLSSVFLTASLVKFHAFDKVLAVSAASLSEISFAFFGGARKVISMPLISEYNILK